MYIRESKNEDIEDIIHIHTVAFGHDKEAELVVNLLNDQSAQPILSLLAFVEDLVVGHILFTNCYLPGTERDVSSVLLAPLAVIPSHQKQGVGGRLIKQGLDTLKGRKTELVFVLGHPSYYPRYGFSPAGCQGLQAPYPLPDQHADAWMVQSLVPEAINSLEAKVVCADALDRPEYWRE
ncbi:GNAT family N-acetyltransferase [Zooshikella harenae]|uniref:N-acetyltransferase n=1 Tax=Zooshikella harenae TaxID=2827238 RepID=A0ABS5Z9S4_9GAMM|nr:N-acetyltransferase [Zooshikella harenae]MBU2710795.1 N-acetyltransferase [Zooshikella harenae]